MADIKAFFRKAAYACVFAGLTSQAHMAVADTFSGGYLAGKQAIYSGDFKSAAQYIERTLKFDKNNPFLLERAVFVYMSIGDIDRAAELGDRMTAAGLTSAIAYMAQNAREAKLENYNSVLQGISDNQGVGPYADDLVAAWARLGQGDMSDALVAFDDAAKKAAISIFVPYHKALALASVGDYEGAASILGQEKPGSLAYTRRGLIASSQILSQLGQNEKALQLVDTYLGASLDPELQKMRADLQDGKTLPFDIIRSPRDGIAEVFYSIAEVFAGRDQDDYMLLYSQVASYLRDNFVEAHLIAGEILEGLQQYELAMDAYSRIPSESLSYHSAELGRVSAARALGRTDYAAEILQNLAQSHPNLPVVHYTQADLLRRLDKYEECAAAYSKALDLFDADEPRHWFLYYARGICNERIGEWGKGEADFRKALELSPEQPQVLNYLGYSLVEQNSKLDEALDMIERALAAAPNNGAITDSLGWALFRLGHYEDAVAPMERAAEILSVDPVINDHLGDVYWAVGRKIEAEFMWRRALSFVDWDGASEQMDADRIRRKLEIGLDDVLEEEGLEPLIHASTGSN